MGGLSYTCFKKVENNRHQLCDVQSGHWDISKSTSGSGRGVGAGFAPGACAKKEDILSQDNASALQLSFPVIWTARTEHSK